LLLCLSGQNAAEQAEGAAQTRLLSGAGEIGMVNHTHYIYRIRWSADDDQFAGLCAELPSLSWLADSQEEALDDRGAGGQLSGCLSNL
jgi:hypothetical protein